VIYLRFAVVLLLAAAIGCSGPNRPDGPVDRYAIEGNVVRVDTTSQIATIQHEDIKGAEGKVWMAAMTMEFPVKEKVEFEKLKEGRRIKGTLFQRPSDFSYWIGEITVMP
jgi:Cu/Ag efflux protein CusF